VRQAVGKWRTVVEDVLVVALIAMRPSIDGTLEDLVVLPVLQGPLFNGRKVGLWIDVRIMLGFDSFGAHE